MGAMTCRRFLSFSWQWWLHFLTSCLSHIVTLQLRVQQRMVYLLHSQHFWLEVHCCLKWPDCRQLKKSWCFLTRFICCSADTFKFPVDIQRVSPNTAWDAGCVSTRYKCRSGLGTGLTLQGLRVAFWISRRTVLEALAHKSMNSRNSA